MFKHFIVAVISSLLLEVILMTPQERGNVMFDLLAEHHDNLILVDHWNEGGNNMYYLYLSPDGTEAYIHFHGGQDGRTDWGDALDACDMVVAHNEAAMERVRKITFYCCYPAKQPRVGAGEFDILCVRGANVDCCVYTTFREDGFDTCSNPLYDLYRQIEVI